MSADAQRVIGFDARFANDQYHGIGRHAYGLLEALTRLDPETRYVAFFNPAYPNTRFDLESLGRRPNVALRPVTLRLYSLAEQLRWPALLATEGVTLFHSPYVTLPLLARCRLAMTVQDLIFERFPAYMPQRHMRLLYRAGVLAGLLRADAVLAGSDATGHDLLRHYPVRKTKVHVVGNGTDASFRRETDPARLSAARERYRLPDRFLFTLGAGRPHKNVETLLDALALLDPATTPALVMGGERDVRFQDTVGERIRRHGLEGRVVRAGKIAEADLPALYSLAEAFVFPSIVEGFGLPPLEAMACGTPVVASNAPSVREVVGDAALRFEADNAQALAAQLRRVLDDAALREDLARRGPTQAASFSWDRVARASLEVYARLLDGPRRAAAR